MINLDDIPYITLESSSLWYVDYTCKKCGQLGTARFSGDYIKESDYGIYVSTVKSIFCCECKSDQISLNDISCYQEGEDVGQSKLFNEGLTRAARECCSANRTIIDLEEKLGEFAEYLGCGGIDWDWRPMIVFVTYKQFSEIQHQKISLTDVIQKILNEDLKVCKDKSVADKDTGKSGLGALLT